MGMIEDASFRRTASHIIDAIGDMGINALVSKWGEDAEGGWELVAFDGAREQWRVEADSLFVAAVELAALVGFDLEG
jgi:hypothetical protein